MSLKNILNHDIPLTKSQRSYARHAEQRRAASNKYYHEKRKFILKDRRREDRENKLRAMLAPLVPPPPPNLALVSPAAASSPLPPSTPPSVQSDDSDNDDEPTLNKEQKALMLDLDAFEKRLEGWESQWGGRRLWTLIADQLHATSSPPLSDCLYEQLRFEHDTQVSDGRDLMQEIWRLAQRCDNILSKSQSGKAFRTLLWVQQDVSWPWKPIFLRKYGLQWKCSFLDFRVEESDDKGLNDQMQTLQMASSIGRAGPHSSEWLFPSVMHRGKLHSTYYGPLDTTNLWSSIYNALKNRYTLAGSSCPSTYPDLILDSSEQVIMVLVAVSTVMKETRSSDRNRAIWYIRHNESVVSSVSMTVSSASQDSKACTRTTLAELYASDSRLFSALLDVYLNPKPVERFLQHHLMEVIRDDALFTATPEEQGLIKGLAHQFLLTRLYGHLETFKRLLHAEWVLVYPSINRLPAFERQRYLGQVWEFATKYLDMYNRLAISKMSQGLHPEAEPLLQLSAFPNALQQRFLNLSLNQLSVLEFMQAEDQATHEHELRRAAEVKEIESMDGIYVGVNLMLHKAGFSMRQIRGVGKENESPEDWGEYDDDNDDNENPASLRSHFDVHFGQAVERKLSEAAFREVSRRSGVSLITSSSVERKLCEAAFQEVSRRSGFSLITSSSVERKLSMVLVSCLPQLARPHAILGSVARFVFEEQYLPRITPPPDDGTVDPHALYNFSLNCQQAKWVLENWFIKYVAARGHNALDPLTDALVAQFNAEYPPLASFNRNQRRIWDVRLARTLKDLLDTFNKWRKKELKFKLIHRRRQMEISLDAVSALLASEEKLQEEKERLEDMIVIDSNFQASKVEDAKERTRDATRAQVMHELQIKEHSSDEELSEEDDQAQVAGAILASDSDLDPADADLGPESEEEVVPSSQPDEDYYNYTAPVMVKPYRVAPMGLVLASKLVVKPHESSSPLKLTCIRLELKGLVLRANDTNTLIKQGYLVDKQGYFVVAALFIPYCSSIMANPSAMAGVRVPLELFRPIALLCDCPLAISSFSRCNKTLYREAAPALYREIHFTSASRGRGDANEYEEFIAKASPWCSKFVLNGCLMNQWMVDLLLRLENVVELHLIHCCVPETWPIRVFDRVEVLQVTELKWDCSTITWALKSCPRIQEATLIYVGATMLLGRHSLWTADSPETEPGAPRRPEGAGLALLHVKVHVDFEEMLCDCILAAGIALEGIERLEMDVWGPPSESLISLHRRKL
ncbi:hypothetical protein C8J56DRAFT_895749 [Mycena floridula]|nr:hypothetical protein C8J56DRAFT_895749 [Mycena floridula]